MPAHIALIQRWLEPNLLRLLTVNADARDDDAGAGDDGRAVQRPFVKPRSLVNN